MWIQCAKILSCVQCSPVHLLRPVCSGVVRKSSVLNVPYPLLPEVDPNEDLSSYTDKTHAFVDYLRVRCTGGLGGNGAVHFLSLRSKRRAGPDGGDGGHGAHVVLRADAQVGSLAHLGKMSEDLDRLSMEQRESLHGATVVLQAPDGAKGRHNNMHGKNAEHAYVPVGFPNAGKSTMLRAMSRARPRVAAYKFTTLRPIIGVVHFDDYTTLNVADLPGLISGAHKNVGLGSAFLRHIERCRCLVYVLDAALDQANLAHQWAELRMELGKYEKKLLEVPSLVLVNKLELAQDILGTAEFRSRLSELRAVTDRPEFMISVSGRRADLVPLLQRAVTFCRRNSTGGSDCWVWNWHLGHSAAFLPQIITA